MKGSLGDENLYQFVDFFILTGRGSAVVASGTSGAVTGSTEARDRGQQKRASKREDAQKKNESLSHFRHILSIPLSITIR